jgi:hypothetical protein
MPIAIPLFKIRSRRSIFCRRGATAAVVAISIASMLIGCASAPPPAPRSETHYVYAIERREAPRPLPPEDGGWRIIAEEDAAAGEARAGQASAGRARDRSTAQETEPLQGSSRDDGVRSLDEADQVRAPAGARRSEALSERSLDQY